MKTLQHIRNVFLLLVIVSINSLLAQNIETVKVFENVPINFGGELSKNSDVMRLENGRIAIKKIKLPEFKKGAEVSVKITLVSAGDRWDKSGSSFLVTDPSEFSLIEINQSDKKYPDQSIVGDGYGGVKRTSDFTPPLELLRFMTPFGVGFYSKEDTTDHKKPVYIPKWEKQVVWESDVTDLRSELSGEVYIGVWIDTWTKEGYEISLELSYDPRKLVNKKVYPIANTVSYGRQQRLPDFFADQDMEVEFNLEKPVKNAVLKYVTSGHGGHSGGDEFVETKNEVFFDNKSVFAEIPWRDDCASFRRFNPSSGVWLVGDSALYIDWDERKYKVKYIEERQASSDLSRSNWCPGSKIEPFEIPLGDLPAGNHKMRVTIPAQKAEENKYNHWLVSAYLVYQTK